MKFLHCSSKKSSFENQMEFTPTCFSIHNSVNKYRLYNLESNSKTQNNTTLTTNTIFLIKDDKTVQYNGNFFYYNCSLSVKNLNFLTQIYQWQTNNSQATISDGEEYISVNSSHVLYLYKIQINNAKQITMGMSINTDVLNFVLEELFKLEDVLDDRLKDLDEEITDEGADEIVEELEGDETGIDNYLADSDSPLSFIIEETSDKIVNEVFTLLEDYVKDYSEKNS